MVVDYQGQDITVEQGTFRGSSDMKIPYPQRLELARTPTPLEPLKRLSAELGVQLYVKRDDLTGAATTGNKVRKLEFLLAEAVHTGCDTRDHGRRRAVEPPPRHGGAGGQAGAAAAACCCACPSPKSPPPTEGNILLDRLAGGPDLLGARTRSTGAAPRPSSAVANEQQAAGHKCYVIPEAGSNPLGAWGYVRCAEELADQLPPGHGDDRLRVRLGRHRRRPDHGLQAARPAVPRGRHQRLRGPRLLRARHQRDRGAGQERLRAQAPVRPRGRRDHRRLRGPRATPRAGRGADAHPRRGPQRGADPRPRLHRQGLLRPDPGAQAQARQPRPAGDLRAHRRHLRPLRQGRRAGAAAVRTTGHGQRAMVAHATRSAGATSGDGGILIMARHRRDLERRRRWQR
ncbi:MAG: pyridoxal-phosphate dependent enzyme [Desulfobacterales bacterium]|nr:pyridoxal-phosphate dependent enzyme [Desulfobacterales bacterium]